MTRRSSADAPALVTVQQHDTSVVLHSFDLEEGHDKFQLDDSSQTATAAAETVPAAGQVVVFEKVTYNGNVGTLTITPYVFRFDVPVPIETASRDATTAATATTNNFNNTISNTSTTTTTMTTSNSSRTCCKCKYKWNQVLQRQLSPPNAVVQPMLKLIILSNDDRGPRTVVVVFSVVDNSTLIRLVKNVKIRMDNSNAAAAATGGAAAAAAAAAAESGSSVNATDDSNSNNVQKATTAPVSSLEEEERAAFLSGTPIHDPVLHNPIKQKQNEDNNDDTNDEEDDEKWWYCCWDDLWFFSCIGMLFVVVLLICGVIYITVLGRKHDSKSVSTELKRPLPPPCKNDNDNNNNDNNNLPDCPPDYGLESRFGIRAVEYVWTTNDLDLQYFISDYVLESSIDYNVYDFEKDSSNNNNNKCDTTAPSPSANLFQLRLLQKDDDDATAASVHLYNKGQGTKKIDLQLKMHSNVNSSTIIEATAFSPSGVTGQKGYLTFCLEFVIYYNDYRDQEEISMIAAGNDNRTGNDGDDTTTATITTTTEKLRVNVIENFVQLSVDVNKPSQFEDVLVGTVTPPFYN